MIAMLGSITMGLVWGWLLVLMAGHGRQPWRSLLLLGLATLLAALLFFLLAAPQPLVFFPAAALSLLLHLGWRRSLRQATSG